MSDLKSIEKRKIEKLFGMESGYVLDFSNRTFQNFILDNSSIDLGQDNLRGMKNLLMLLFSYEKQVYNSFPNF